MLEELLNVIVAYTKKHFVVWGTYTLYNFVIIYNIYYE